MGNLKTVEIKREEIIIWLNEDQEIQAAWKRDGQHALPEVVYRDKTIDELVVYLETHDPCSQCGQDLPITGPAGSHFAGRFCEPCWEAYYKNRSTRLCGLCRQPLYSCTC